MSVTSQRSAERRSSCSPTGQGSCPGQGSCCGPRRCSFVCLGLSLSAGEGGNRRERCGKATAARSSSWLWGGDRMADAALLERPSLQWTRSRPTDCGAERDPVRLGARKLTDDIGRSGGGVLIPMNVEPAIVTAHSAKAPRRPHMEDHRSLPPPSFHSVSTALPTACSTRLPGAPGEHHAEHCHRPDPGLPPSRSAVYLPIASQAARISTEGIIATASGKNRSRQ
jgi:hypothetical protein